MIGRSPPSTDRAGVVLQWRVGGVGFRWLVGVVVVVVLILVTRNSAPLRGASF